MRGRTSRPVGDGLARLASVLGVGEDVLLGEAPWPKKLSLAETVLSDMGRSPASKHPRQRRSKTISILEFDLRSKIAMDTGEIFTPRRRPISSWGIPSEALNARSLPHQGLVVVHSPANLHPDISTGDHLLVDTTSAARLPSPPGTFIIFDGLGHGVAHVKLVRDGKTQIVRFTTTEGSEEHGLDGAGICGRIVGRWVWG